MSVDKAVGEITAAARTAVEDYEAERDAELATVKEQVATLNTALVLAKADAKAVQDEFDAHMQTHVPTPDPEPEPEPEPEPVPVPPVTKTHGLNGMSSPKEVWAERKKQVEATGGKLEARRIFLSGLTASTSLIDSAFSENLHPVVSWKVGSSWSAIANGGQDAALKSLAQKLNSYNRPISAVFHHEPDEAATPPDVGEGGSAADFARMQGHIIDVMRPLAPKVLYSVIVNGWWFSAQARGLSDAEINVWLPPTLRTKLDIIATDQYNAEGGEKAVVRTKRQVEWAKRMGNVKATGIGETNGFVDGDLETVYAYVKTEPLFNKGWCLVWNSTGDAFLPLTESGLLDNYQKILKEWR